MSDWISIAQASSMSGYHPEHLRELVRESKVKARKIVTVWQIDRASLQAYIRAADSSSDRRRGAKSRKAD